MMTTEPRSGYGKETIAARGNDWRKDTTDYEEIGRALLYDMCDKLSTVPGGTYFTQESTDKKPQAVVMIERNDDDVLTVAVRRLTDLSQDKEWRLPERERWIITRGEVAYESSDATNQIMRIDDPAMHLVLARGLECATDAAEAYRRELEASL